MKVQYLMVLEVEAIDQAHADGMLDAYHVRLENNDIGQGCCRLTQATQHDVCQFNVWDGDDTTELVPPLIDGESPPEPCDCETPGAHLTSGLPGVLAVVTETGKVLSTIQRCDVCGRYQDDEAAKAALVKWLSNESPA